MHVVRTNQLFLIFFLLLFLSIAGFYGCNQRSRVQAAGENPDAIPGLTESDFMVKATQAHLAEIDMARLAKLQSKNERLKSYAGMVLHDHTDALADVTKLMKEKNVPEPKTFAAETKQDIARMSRLEGSEFDREFVNMMVSDHQKALELFRNTSASAHDTGVQDYADNMIPKLEKHLQKAQELQSKLFSGRARQ